MKRFTLIVFLCVIMFSVLFCPMHDCAGESCEICAFINTLKIIAVLPSCALLYHRLTVLHFEKAANGNKNGVISTLISLKTELLS